MNTTKVLALSFLLFFSTYVKAERLKGELGLGSIEDTPSKTKSRNTDFLSFELKYKNVHLDLESIGYNLSKWEWIILETSLKVDSNSITAKTNNSALAQVKVGIHFSQNLSFFIINQNEIFNSHGGRVLTGGLNYNQAIYKKYLFWDLTFKNTVESSKYGAFFYDKVKPFNHELSHNTLTSAIVWKLSKQWSTVFFHTHRIIDQRFKQDSNLETRYLNRSGIYLNFSF